MSYRRRTRREEEVRERRKSGWEHVGEIGLRALKQYGPTLAYGAVGALTGFNTEKKYFDVQSAPALTNGYSNGGNGIVLTNCAAGVDGNDRLGRSIRINDFQIRIHIFPNTAALAGAGSPQHRMRVVIAFDREGNVNPGQAPSVTDLFQDVTTAPGRLSSPLQVINFGRFQILHDKMYFQGASTTGGVGMNDSHDYMEFKHVFEDHHALWDPTSADYTQGHIFIWFIWANSTCPAGVPTYDTTTTSGPGVYFYSRIRFVDN